MSEKYEKEYSIGLCGQLCTTMDFSVEMDEVEAFLRTNQYPVNIGNDKGKKANFRRKCRSFVIHDDCLKFVHKPNRKDMTGEYCSIQ